MCRVFLPEPECRSSLTARRGERTTNRVVRRRRHGTLEVEDRGRRILRRHGLAREPRMLVDHSIELDRPAALVIFGRHLLLEPLPDFRQVPAHLRQVPISLVRIFGERPIDDRSELGVDVGANRRHRRVRLLEDLPLDLLEELELTLRTDDERFPKQEQLVGNGADGEHVAPRIGIEAPDLLRRDVIRREQQLPTGQRPARALHFGDAEIQDLQRADGV